MFFCVPQGATVKQGHKAYDSQIFTLYLHPNTIKILKTMANSGNNTNSPDSKAGTKPSGNTARKTTKKRKKTTHISSDLKR